LVLSDGEPIAHPKHTGSRELRLHANASEVWRDFLDKTSTDSVRRLCGIAVENPAARDKVKSLCLAKSISAIGITLCGRRPGP
jgi:hypothetical protein